MLLWETKLAGNLHLSIDSLGHLSTSQGSAEKYTVIEGQVFVKASSWAYTHGPTVRTHEGWSIRLCCGGGLGSAAPYSLQFFFFFKGTRCGLACKDGNGSGSDGVESPCTQNRNPKSKPETDSGGNPSPKLNPRINIHIFTCINKRK